MFNFNFHTFISNFLGNPIIVGNSMEGKFSPAKPALINPEPLSKIIFFSGIWIFATCNFNYNYISSFLNV